MNLEVTFLGETVLIISIDRLKISKVISIFKLDFSFKSIDHFHDGDDDLFGWI